MKYDVETVCLLGKSEKSMKAIIETDRLFLKLLFEFIGSIQQNHSTFR